MKNIFLMLPENILLCFKDITPRIRDVQSDVQSSTVQSWNRISHRKEPFTRDSAEPWPGLGCDSGSYFCLSRTALSHSFQSLTGGFCCLMLFLHSHQSFPSQAAGSPLANRQIWGLRNWRCLDVPETISGPSAGCSEEQLHG